MSCVEAIEWKNETRSSYGKQIVKKTATLERRYQQQPAQNTTDRRVWGDRAHTTKEVKKKAYSANGI